MHLSSRECWLPEPVVAVAVAGVAALEAMEVAALEALLPMLERLPPQIAVAEVVARATRPVQYH